MVESINVIGRGRVGSALAARLEERGLTLREDDAELTLLCVPDSAIRDVAQGLSLGPGRWVAHVSGATPLAALPAEFEGIHRKHMLVRGGERRDSAWYAVVDDDWPEVRSALERRLEARG